jgi:hypothetical protein
VARFSPTPGPLRALNFWLLHQLEAAPDARYCDQYGQNVIGNPNGYLRKKQMWIRASLVLAERSEKAPRSASRLQTHGMRSSNAPRCEMRFLPQCRSSLIGTKMGNGRRSCG